MNQPFDRGAEDLGNSIHLEHVNVQVPDQRLAALFYVAGLGLTRDLLEPQGGRISLASEPGRGSEVTILLPVAREAHQ